MMRGQKLRKALIIVWLASKYDKTISKAELRRMIGYDSSGLYGAKEHDWFEEKEGRLALTDKGRLYLQEDVIPFHRTVRYLLCYMAIFPLLLFVDWVLLTHFKIIFVFDPYSTVTSFLALLVFAWSYYRVVWWLLKMKKG